MELEAKSKELNDLKLLISVDESIVNSFNELQYNSSDIASRLICAMSLYNEARKARNQSIAEEILNWIYQYSGGDLDSILNQDKIELSDLSMKGTLMRALASTLPDMHMLQYLILHKANIDAEMAQILCGGLISANYLKVLDLQYNELGPLGAKEIGSLKTTLTHLEVIYFNDQHSPIGPDGAKHMLTPLSNQSYLSTVRKICFGGNQIKDEGVQYIVNAFPYMKQLQTLFLYDNEITDRGAGLLLDNLHLAPSLQYIATSGNLMSSAMEANIQQTLSTLASSRQAPVMQQLAYEPVVLRTLMNQSPGVQQIFLQGDLVREDAEARHTICLSCVDRIHKACHENCSNSFMSDPGNKGFRSCACMEGDRCKVCSCGIATHVHKRWLPR